MKTTKSLLVCAFAFVWALALPQAAFAIDDALCAVEASQPTEKVLGEAPPGAEGDAVALPDSPGVPSDTVAGGAFGSDVGEQPNVETGKDPKDGESADGENGAASDDAAKPSSDTGGASMPDAADLAKADPAANRSETAPKEGTAPSADAPFQFAAVSAQGSANAPKAQVSNPTTTSPKPRSSQTRSVNVPKAQVSNPTTSSSKLKSSQTRSVNAPKAQVRYRTHVQNVGWQGWKSNGTMAGTTGRSLRLEGVYIQLLGADGRTLGKSQGGIQYQGHVENLGWQDVRADGTMAGTTGKSYRLEALRIMLTGDISRFYDVFYRTHVQNIGWQDWKKNGAMAGTTGRSLRLEALEIRLALKARETTAPIDGIVNVRVRTHVQNVGWQAQVQNGATAGTTGSSLRLEAMQVNLDKGTHSGGVQYRTHVQNIGWQKWQGNGAIAGTTGRSLRVEAMQLSLTGEIATGYDILYRTHVQSIGWQNWALNGAIAGTTGRSLRVEALQIKLVKKGSNQAISEGTYFFSPASGPQLSIDDSSVSAKSGAQLKVAGSDYSNAQRYYVRNEGSGNYSIQSVNSALFLADNNGKVVHVADSKAAANRWKVAWNGGYSLVNAATGKLMSLVGGKSASGTALDGQNDAGKAAQRWVLTSTALLGDGTYIISCDASGNVLDVNGLSFANGAGIYTHSANRGGNQAFTLGHCGSNNYNIGCALTYKAVAASGSSVQQYAWNGSSGQVWNARLQRDGGIVFVNKGTGKALNATGKAASGDRVNVAKVNGSKNQKWSLKLTSFSLSGNSSLDYQVARILGNHTSLKSAYNYVVGLSYREGKRFYSGSHYLSNGTTRKYALEMANRKSGNCYRYASLFSWLARGLGYDTKVCRGWVPSVSGGRAPHGWVELYENGKTYCYDPCMANSISRISWYGFTYRNAPINYEFW